MLIAKKWILGLAVVTALALGMVSASWGNWGISNAEAVSLEQHQCGDNGGYERFIVDYPSPGAFQGALIEKTTSDRFLDRSIVQCESDSICDELTSPGRQFPIPMTIWEWPQHCGSPAEADLPSF